MDEWVEFMEKTIIPFQIAKGMVITGSFRSEDDSTYVWTRRFENDDEYTELYDKVYKSDTWIQKISPRIIQSQASKNSLAEKEYKSSQPCFAWCNNPMYSGIKLKI